MRNYVLAYCLRLNVTWVDFEALAFIRHFFSHLSILSRLLWSFSEAISGSLWLAKMAVSSAYVADVISGVCGRSAVNMVYNTGPSTEP